jgi:hypothetical protein
VCFDTFWQFKTLCMISERFQSCKLPWRSARVPQHPFPRSVDGDGEATVKKESKKEIETVANNYLR